MVEETNKTSYWCGIHVNELNPCKKKMLLASAITVTFINNIYLLSEKECDLIMPAYSFVSGVILSGSIRLFEAISYSNEEVGKRHITSIALAIVGIVYNLLIEDKCHLLHFNLAMLGFFTDRLISSRFQYLPRNEVEEV